MYALGVVILSLMSLLKPKMDLDHLETAKTTEDVSSDHR